MHSLKAWPARFVCIAICAAPLFAQAQGASPTPPGLERLDDESDASAASRPERATGSGVTEKRLPGGRVTEIEVRSGASTYYLKPQTATGGAPAGNGQAGLARTPQWNVLNFDLPGARKANSQGANDGPASAPAPPPPRAN